MCNRSASPVMLRVKFLNNSVAADGDGGGGAVFNGSNSDADLSSVLFDGNSVNAYSFGRGGGMYSKNSKPVLNGVVFTNNSVLTSDGVANGGAVSNNGSTVTMNDVSFGDNDIDGESANGGAVSNNDSTVTMSDVSFVDNSAHADSYAFGGALYNWNSSDVTLVDVSFVNNQVVGGSGDGGGAIFNNSGSSLSVSQCSFYNNHDYVFTNFSTTGVTVVNSVFFGSTVGDIDGSGTTDVTYTCSQQVIAGAGNQQLTDDPFDIGPNGELFLLRNSFCVDNGSDTDADAAYAPGGWSGLTTAKDGTTEGATTVDMGVHYTP